MSKYYLVEDDGRLLTLETTGELGPIFGQVWFNSPSEAIQKKIDWLSKKIRQTRKHAAEFEGRMDRLVEVAAREGWEIK